MSTSKKQKKKHSKSLVKESLCHQNFITQKFGKDRDFIIIHYAGEVHYNATGFVEKNVETLSNELKDLGFTSSNESAQAVFGATGLLSPAPAADLGTTSGHRSSIRRVSIASQFWTSLQMLVTDLGYTNLHYVRCIKPNSSKAYGVFESGEVVRQLWYSGMMKTISIHQEGYSNHDLSFYQQFHILLSTEETKMTKAPNIWCKCYQKEKRLSLSEAEWQIGHSKIFLRLELASKLVVLAKLQWLAATCVIEKIGCKIACSQAGRPLAV
jgi:myosin heavy subunit